MPRTKPVISRPSLKLSSIANSSAIATGLLTSGNARPSTQIFARLVVRASEAAIRFGAGMMPYAV